MTELRYAVITDGTVSNTIIGPANLAIPGLTLVQSDTAGIGYTYSNGTFTAPPPPVATPAQLIQHAQYVQAQFLQAGQTFNVAASGAASVNVLCDGTQSTRSDLALLALYGQANPSGSKTWIDNNGVSTVLSGTELVQLATLAGDWITDTYSSLSQIMTEITATTPSLTTTAQIDAFTWPTS